MANSFLFANNASSSLAAPISNSASSLSVQSGTGSEFPTPGANQQFSATLNDAATGLLYEVVYCTVRSGDTFTTIARAQEGTVALSWLAGDLIANVPTAGQMAAFVQTVTANPNRVVSASGVFTTTTADAFGRIGLQRTSTVAPSSTTLPSNASAGQTYTIEDLQGNFQANPCTVNAPVGQSIAGLAAKIMNVNRQSCTFTYYGNNIWSVADAS